MSDGDTCQSGFRCDKGWCLAQVKNIFTLNSLTKSSIHPIIPSPLHYGSSPKDHFTSANSPVRFIYPKYLDHKPPKTSIHATTSSVPTIHHTKILSISIHHPITLSQHHQLGHTMKGAQELGTFESSISSHQVTFEREVICSCGPPGCSSSVLARSPQNDPTLRLSLEPTL